MKNHLQHICIYLSLLLSCYCFGQKSKVDSLSSVFNSTSQTDTNRLKAINSIAWIYINNNPDTAILLAEKQLSLAGETKQKNEGDQD